MILAAPAVDLTIATVATPKLRESDLYPPLREHLEQLGYMVRGEVLDCDLAAVRGDELIAVELKVGFNATLLIQAVARQRACDSVYVAIPRPRTTRGLDWQGMLHVLKRLGMGLLVVDPASPVPVQVVLDPRDWRQVVDQVRRAAILTEIAGRSADHNQGGVNRRPLVTAYRERAIRIAASIGRDGQATTAGLRARGTGEQTAQLLYQDVYGWFVRIAKGTYRLSEDGREALVTYGDLARRYAGPGTNEDPAAETAAGSSTRRRKPTSTST